MRCKSKTLKNKKGSTLVEILMSFVAMLLLVGILAGAISFSNRAVVTSGRISARAAEAAAGLRKSTGFTKEDDTNYKFTVVGGTGTNVLFEINVDRIKREVALTDGTTIDFYQFQPGKAPSEGGD